MQGRFIYPDGGVYDGGHLNHVPRDCEVSGKMVMLMAGAVKLHWPTELRPWHLHFEAAEALVQPSKTKGTGCLSGQSTWAIGRKT